MNGQLTMPRRVIPAWPFILIVLLLVGLAYGTLPRTKHADVTRQDAKWNPVTIQDYFNKGKCKPNIDICQAEDFEVHWCEVNDGMSIGLVIGHTIRQVITGYMARTNYWSNKCQTP